MKKLLLAAACVFALSGCTSVASTVSSIATDFSTATTSQVSTLADAVLVADTLTKAADTYVNSGVTISAATLKEIQSLSNAMHSALSDLQAANAAGKSLDYAAFNAALDAYETYATSQAIPQS